MKRLYVFLILLIVLIAFRPSKNDVVSDYKESTNVISNVPEVSESISKNKDISPPSYIESTPKSKIKSFDYPPGYVKQDSLFTSKVKKKKVHRFKCDGRKYCSQMHSYEEAIYFLRNCPKVKMDGDHDGRPCERQFGR